MVFAETSNIKTASGSPCKKNLFFARSRLFFVQSKIVLSINSQLYKSCFIAITVASKLSFILVKWVHTIILSDGGKGSNSKVIAVEKAKVPSLPDKNFATFIVGADPPNKSDVKNSSTAYPVFLLCIASFGNCSLISS